ncbi:MAG TPA: hypothetical protein VKU00_09585 [Chthonomonadaceae bacterium]|nr:hypothetical protein [Chthonomonadaceae bacterium]
MRTWRRSVRFSTPILNLCVTCGCVGILVPILFPLVATSRYDHRPSCMSHIKQLGLALILYSQDYDNRLPRAGDWMDATYPYSKNRNVYRCPDLQPARPKDFGYAFNSTFANRAMTAISDPWQEILLYDSTNLSWNANAPGLTGMANPPRHHGGDNVGFADGHAGWVKLTTVRE